MIELFTANTPNGKKISIMLEEIQYDYKVTIVNILKDEQFKPEFKKISPFSKIPVIKDHKNGNTLFESGAILIYLGEQSGKFYDQDKRTIINQWLMAQMAYVGPMLGQHTQHTAPSARVPRTAPLPPRACLHCTRRARGTLRARTPARARARAQPLPAAQTASLPAHTAYSTMGTHTPNDAARPPQQ